MDSKRKIPAVLWLTLYEGYRIVCSNLDQDFFQERKMFQKASILFFSRDFPFGIGDDSISNLQVRSSYVFDQDIWSSCSVTRFVNHLSLAKNSSRLENGYQFASNFSFCSDIASSRVERKKMYSLP